MNHETKNRMAQELASALGLIGQDRQLESVRASLSAAYVLGVGSGMHEQIETRMNAGELIETGTRCQICDEAMAIMPVCTNCEENSPDDVERALVGRFRAVLGRPSCDNSADNMIYELRELRLWYESLRDSLESVRAVLAPAGSRASFADGARLLEEAEAHRPSHDPMHALVSRYLDSAPAKAMTKVRRQDAVVRLTAFVPGGSTAYWLCKNDRARSFIDGKRDSRPCTACLATHSCFRLRVADIAIVDLVGHVVGP